MQLFACKWRLLTGREGEWGDMTFMTHRHNEHQLKIGLPAAVNTWKALPELWLSLLLIKAASPSTAPTPSGPGQGQASQLPQSLSSLS